MADEKVPKVFHSDGNGGFGLTKMGRHYIHALALLGTLLGGGSTLGIITFFNDLNADLNRGVKADLRSIKNREKLADFKLSTAQQLGNIRAELTRIRAIMEERRSHE